MRAAQHIRVRGIVQGVGFRPFVWRLARELKLSGWVRNDSRGVEMTGLAGVDLKCRRPGCPYALGVACGLLVALDDFYRPCAPQVLDGPHQQRGLARARAGHEVQRLHAARRELGAIRRRIAVVLLENVAFELHDPAAAGRARARGPWRTRVIVRVIVRVSMRMLMLARLERRAFQPYLLAAAAACRAHVPTPPQVP